MPYRNREYILSEWLSGTTGTAIAAKQRNSYASSENTVQIDYVQPYHKINTESALNTSSYHTHMLMKMGMPSGNAQVIVLTITNCWPHFYSDQYVFIYYEKRLIRFLRIFYSLLLHNLHPVVVPVVLLFLDRAVHKKAVS